MNGLYERIAEITNKNGITGKELGEKLGLKKSPLTDWKNKKSNPTLEQFAKMCEIFATTPEWLLTGKEAAELSTEEQELVECYRQSNDQGKRTIMGIARMQKQELESSDSKIG